MSEAADGLGVDEINLAGFAIGHQEPEAWASADAPARADVNVCINILPVGAVQDVLHLEINLRRQAVHLPFHLGADPALQGNTPECTGRLHGSGDGYCHGLGLSIIRHDWFCIGRFVVDG